jgi:uncharacterized damage-inducible protein DinB
MDQAERLESLQRLQAGRDALGRALQGVDEDWARRKPPSGGWSILDCLEHLAATERYLLTRLQAARLAGQPFEKTRREAKIAALAVDRTRRIEAPEPSHPQGRFRSIRDALAALDDSRAEVVRWVESCEADPRRLLTDHPLIEGPVTCSEMLVMIAAHPARHAGQIEEVKQELSKLIHPPTNTH